MTTRNICLFILGLIYFFGAGSCNSKEMEISIVINSSITTNAVSSGSGLACHDNTVYLVGDDASYIAVLEDTSKSAFTRIALQSGLDIGREEKAIKHDLEAALIGTIDDERLLFAFGSGSLSPYRDTMFAMNVKTNNVSHKCSLLPLYEAIKTKAGLDNNEFNIEGAALAGERLYLFNRGKNMAIIIAWSAFMKYVQNPTGDLPTFKLQTITLPVVNNFSVGISGVCAINKNELLFTASLEETKDNFADGIIKGSYIGVLRINDNDKITLATLQPFKDDSGNTILDKLEAIEIIKQQGNSMQAIAMADNDDGKSKLFYLTILKK